jgi:hypothetical protein
MNTSGDSFELEPLSTGERDTTVKWSVGNTKYEIHIPVLNRYELGHIVHHCMLVKHKINQEVGTVNNRYRSYVSVFPRTLSLALVSIWDNILTDYPVNLNDPNAIQADEAGFDRWIGYFIEANATDDDRHELLDFIRHSTKPKKMKVQAFYIRLRELNDMVDLLPGTEAKLTQSQLDQAFHDAMLESWRRFYAQAGRSLRTDNHARCLQFFRAQQANSDRAEFRNQSKMKLQKSKNHDEFESPKPRGRKRQDSKHRLSRQEHKKRGQSKKTEDGKNNRIADSDPCPIHRGSNHTWGECFQNARNKKPSGDKKPPNGKFKSKFKPKNKDEDVDANVMHCSDCDISTASSIESGEASSSDEGSYNTQMKQAINDVSMTDVDDEFDANGYDLAMAEFIDECNSGTSHPTDYVGEHKEFMQARLEQPIPKKKKKAKATASPEAGQHE